MHTIEDEPKQRYPTHLQNLGNDPLDLSPTQIRLPAYPKPQPSPYADPQRADALHFVSGGLNGSSPYGSSPFFVAMDGVPVEEQITWIIPVIYVPEKAPKLDIVRVGGGYSLQLRNVLKSSGIYALSSLATPLVALVLAPFLTRSFSHADYGSLAVINTAIALLAGITQLGLWTAFLRSYTYDYESRIDRAGVLSTSVVLLLFVSVPTTLILMLIAPWVGTALLNGPFYGNDISVAAMVVLLQNLAVPGLAWMRAENRAVLFSLVSLANLLINLIVTIFLVGFLHLGVVGSLIGTGCGYACVVLCTIPFILLRAGVRMRIDIAHGLLTFGLPNVSSYISLWMLQLADRFLLAHLRSLSETAIYTVAYSLGGIMSVLILSPFAMAWSANQFTIAKRVDAKNVFQLVFRWYSIVLCFATYALSLAGIFVLDTFFPQPYHVAAPIVPLITLSTLFYGLYSFLTLGMNIRKKTGLTVMFTALAALVNIGLNLLFIPLYGSIGAALATLLAYMLLALLTYRVNQRIYPVPFEIGMFSTALGIGAALYLGSTFLAQGQPPSIAWTIQLCALCLYACCLALLGKRWRRKL